MDQTTKYLNTRMAAQYVGLSMATLEQKRFKGHGPSYVKLPGRQGRVLYRPEDLDQWMESLLVKTK